MRGQVAVAVGALLAAAVAIVVAAVLTRRDDAAGASTPRTAAHRYADALLTRDAAAAAAIACPFAGQAKRFAADRSATYRLVDVSGRYPQGFAFADYRDGERDLSIVLEPMLGRWLVCGQARLAG